MRTGIDLARAMGNKEHADAIEAMKEQLLIILIGRMGGSVKVTVGEVDTATIGKVLDMRLDPRTNTFEFGVRALTEPLPVLMPKAEPLPVDRTKRELVDGKPVTEGFDTIQPSGMQRDYVVLSDEERAKGFVRPVRLSYVHVGRNPVFSGSVLIKVGEGGCGTQTKMHRSIAETYARDPKFYGGTFCCGCGTHLPLAGFVWEGTTEIVGS